MNKNHIILLVGPTAVGKTEISLEIAESLNAEIISADSRLLYKGMNIGTAKPTESEMARVPHHLINVAEIDQPWSIAVYLKRAFSIVDEIWAQGKLPLFVGGTGQYIRALIEGWDIPEIPPNPKLRDVVREWGELIGSQALYDKLQIIDPKAAEAIEPNNLRRIVRAFEVILSTGEMFSLEKGRKAINFNYKIIGLNRDRSSLYKRIDLRIEKMIDDGFVEEARGLLAAGFTGNEPPLSAIGYKQIIQYINGVISLEEAIMIMKRKTRQYVRRQANWFKPDDAKIRWFEAEKANVNEIIAFIQSRDGWYGENE